MKHKYPSSVPGRSARRAGLPQRRLRQPGFTLVELMVAVTLGLLVAAAAVAALLIGRQGFNNVDSSTQLRESARFAATMIDKIVLEAGFENAAYGVVTTPKAPGVRGFENSLVGAESGLPASLAHDSRTTAACGSATGTTCMNGSDVLMLRFWGVSRNGVADGSIVNCAGIPEPEATTADPRAYSIFHIRTAASGEPTLACSYRVPGSTTFVTVPLVQGVESLQVLYGTTGVTPGVCSGTVSIAGGGADVYLTAKQLDGASGYCDNNWQRVRSVRIGLLVRGLVGSAPASTQTTWNVLGTPTTPGLTTYSYVNVLGSNDLGSSLTTTADGRLRQQLVFTVHLRNAQYSP